MSRPPAAGPRAAPIAPAVAQTVAARRSEPDRMRQELERARDRGGAADGLQAASGDQRRERRRDAAEQAAEGEHAKPRRR